MTPVNLSIFILTLNEEINIAACIEAVSWSDDVVVLDSFSSDRTVEIARQYPNVRVIQRAFDNWAAHQNWAMETIDFRHPWVFYLDADERMTPALREELLAIAGDNAQLRVAYYCGRKNYFMGRWIRHAMPPGTIMRFFKPAHVRFERLVNPVPVIRGAYGYLTHYFDHYNFSKGLREWMEKHNKYSQAEALESLKLIQGRPAWTRLAREIFSRDRAVRRQAIKAVAAFIPGRALLRFLYTLLINRGILDGLAGFHYALLIAMYEYWIEIKVREAQQDWPARNQALAQRMLAEQRS